MIIHTQVRYHLLKWLLLVLDCDSVKDHYIYSYASIYIKRDFFIVGGFIDGSKSNTVGRLDAVTWSWSIAGRLNTARIHHGVIWLNSKLIVVGGESNGYPYELKHTTEFCRLENFACTVQDSILSSNDHDLLLFAVRDDYRNC